MSSNIKEVTLDLCGSAHCPSIRMDEQKVVFKDDFGGKVKLTRQEFDILKRIIIEGKI